MEVFTRMLESAASAGLVSRFSVGQLYAAANVSHLLFADDTIIFCDNVCKQIVNLRRILIWFKAVGQVVNIRLLAGVIGFPIDSFSTSYLGLPLGAKFKDKSIWQSVVARFERRLSGLLSLTLPFTGQWRISQKLLREFCGVFW